MKEKSIKVNFIMNTILTMSSFVFPLITFPYVSRILMPAGTGAVSFATSLITYFNLFAQLGIPVYGIRACAQVRDDREELSRVTQELLIISLVMSAVAYSFLGLALAFIPRLFADRTLYIIVSATIILTAIGMEWLYKALECYSYITIRSVAFKCIALVAMFVLIHKPEDYIVYGGLTIFAASASNILNLINAHKYVDLKPKGNYNFKRHLKAVMVFFAMSCATTIYTNLDNVMLGFMQSNVEVGYYDAAVKVKLVLVSIVVSLGAVLLPRASYYVESDRMNEFWDTMRKSLEFVWLLAPAIIIYFAFFSRETILVLSGDKYIGAIVPMRILLPTVLFIGLSNFVGIQILVPLGKESIVLKSEVIGGAADFVLNLILIPKVAAAGAAIGTLVAEILVFMVQYASMRNRLHKYFMSVQYIKIGISASTALAGSMMVKTLDIRPFWTLALSAFIFWIIYCTMLIVMKEPLSVDIWNGMIRKYKESKGE